MSWSYLEMLDGMAILADSWQETQFQQQWLINAKGSPALLCIATKPG